MKEKHATVRGPGKLVRFARWLLLPYLLGVVFLAFGSFLMAGYGLAHASEGAIGAFMLILALTAAAAMLLPLALLTNSAHPVWVALRALGLIVMAFTSTKIFEIVWQLEIEPRMMNAKFRSVMQRLEPGALQEEPLLIGAVPAGVRVIANIRLTEATDMDQYGALLLDAMRSMQLAPATRGVGSVALNKFPYQATISFQGKPLEALPGFERPTQAGASWPSASAALPAGIYRAESQFWFPGISSLPGDAGVCRDDALDKDQWQTALLKQMDRAARPVISTRLSLKYRLGYPSWHREWAPLKFRGNEATWRAAFSTLALDTCSVRKALQEREAKAREVMEAEQKFAAGDTALPTRLNPLFLAMCAGDVEKTRRLLAEPVASRFDLEAMTVECAVKRRDADMLALALPKLFGQTGEKEGYCTVLLNVYGTRSAELLQRIDALQLPLQCDGADGNYWSRSLDTKDENGNPMPIAWDDEMHHWLQFLLKHGVSVCSRTSEGSLLAEAVLEAPRKTLELLLDAGCDPRTFGRSAKAGELTAGEQWLGSATSLWPIRRYLQGRFGIGPLTSDDIKHITGRVGTATDEYIAINQDGSTFQFRFRRQLLAEPALLRYMLQHGGQTDLVGGKQCESWYTPGYQPSDPAATELPEKALLDSLSDQELKALAKPFAVHCSARPLTETKNFAPNGLGTYLCRRGIVACPQQN